jgi:hypothetical protein
MRFNLGYCYIVRLQISRLAGIQKSSLAGLCILQLRFDLAQLEKYLPRVQYPGLACYLDGELSPRDERVRNQDEQQQDKASQDSGALIKVLHKSEGADPSELF